MSGEDVEKAGIEDAWETDSGPCFQGVLMLRFLQTIGSPRIIFADRIGKEDNDKFNYARGAMLINIVHESERRFKVDNWPVCQKDKLTVA